MHDDSEDIDALIDKELSLLTIGKDERVPCRDFEYPVVRWTEKELQATVAPPLLSDDPLSLLGCSVGIEKGAKPPKEPRKVPPPVEDDIDIADALKQPAELSNEKWADVVTKFKEFLRDSEQQDKLITESVEELRTLELPACLQGEASRQVREEAAQPTPRSEAASSCPQDDVMHLSDISDEEERALVDADALADLQKGFREEVEALKRHSEEQAKQAQQACEEEFTQRVLKEEKLQAARPVYQPIDVDRIKLMADDTCKRDVEFTSNLEEAEAKINREIAQARDELRQLQEEQRQRKAAEDAELQREEEERRARQAVKLEEMHQENRRRKIEERKQYRALKEASERLTMEAADIESLHALVMLEEKRKKEAAVQQARLARLRAEHEGQQQAEQENIMDEEREVRKMVVHSQQEEYAGFKDPFVALCEYAARMLQQRQAVLAANSQSANAIESDEQQTRALILEWVGTCTREWAAEIIAFYKDEDDSRASIQSAEAGTMQRIIEAAEADHCKVEEVLVSIDLAKKKREAFTTCEKETSEGVLRLSSMLGAVSKGPAAVAVPCRLMALRLQSSFRNEWARFFNPNAIPLIRKRKIIPEEHKHQGKSLPSPHPPVKEGTMVLNMEYFRRVYSLCKLDTLSKVSITFEKITKVVGPFPELANLTDLDLSNNNISSFSGLIHGLRSLDLTDNSLGCTRFLADLPCLEKVKLDSNKINSLTGVEECTRLKTLSARHNYLSGTTVLEECTSLASLDLFGNNLTTLAVPEVSSLTYLNVGRNALTDVSNILRSCTLLMEAHLYNNRIASLPSRIHNVLLQSLLLSDNVLEKIPDLAHLPLLTMLDVSSNKLHDVTGVRGCLHLEVLNLAFNELGNAQSVLAPCRTLHRLQRLDVNDNPFWEADKLGIVKANLARLLPSLRYLNSMPVEERETPLECYLENQVAGILNLCRPCGKGALPDTEAYNLACYDELCLVQIRERRRVESDARRAEIPSYQKLEDLALQQVQAHATTGVQHLQHKFRSNVAYDARRVQHKRNRAALRICLWYRSRRRHAWRSKAAVRIQALWKGHFTRRRLREHAWVDADKEAYGKVAVDFGDEVDTSRFRHMGEILGAALARHGVPAPKQIVGYQSIPTPPSEPRTPSEVRERFETNVERDSRDGTPLNSATLAWSSGMMKREKKFEKIKKKRMSEERYLYDRTKTLESKKSLVNKTIERAATTASGKKHDTPPPPADLEVESLSSTLSAHRSFKKTTSLPPLNRPN